MPSLLLVDDRPQNLLALRAILEPLGHELVTAGSGAEALRILLHRDDFAVILLDVQMPELDGFEVAEVIKQRERTSTIPIIFLTALSKEEKHVFRGYEVGAVDYVFKPFEPELLRAKVDVFVDLWEKNNQIRQQAELLAAQELAELRRASAERYRQLADAMPQIVWTADSQGNATYYNRRWFEYTGMTEAQVDEHAWSRVTHPDDLPPVVAETRADAARRERLRGRVSISGRGRNVSLASRPGGADPARRRRVDRFLDRHRDGHRRPEADRGGAALPARRRYRAFPLTRLARGPHRGGAPRCATNRRLVRHPRGRGGRDDLDTRARARRPRKGDLRE